MTEEKLIFDWEDRRTKTSHKLLAILIVMIVFTFFFNAINVRFGFTQPVTKTTASVIHFANDDLGKFWRLRAEEEGPFPGALEHENLEQVADLRWIINQAGGSIWNPDKPTIARFKTTDGLGDPRLALEGEVVFPKQAGEVEKVVEADLAVGERKKIPMLISNDSSWLKWQPEEFPAFDGTIAEDDSSSTWNFLLSLRADGRVGLCFPDQQAPELIETWLKKIRFQKGAGERWLSVRVEFINQVQDGSKSE
ncbi:MAG: hypothetical protein H7Y36_05170 [Armatimonadetes bacterium]|nr:hypothetical protein [Akkermansiaceae bacterium]